jgi:hypothetical protein
MHYPMTVAERWAAWKRKHPGKERVARRFRHHVRTPRNPRGRIQREPCGFCPDPNPAEAHHLDYSRPFLVVWSCEDCHRAIEQGRVRVLARHTWDYSSLIPVRPNAWREGARLPRHADEGLEPAPF